MFDFILQQCLVCDKEEPNFQINDHVGFPDLTPCNGSLAQNLTNWQVVEEETHSDHKYITYDLNFNNDSYHRIIDSHTTRETWCIPESNKTDSKN